ncbi:MAG: DUF1697 domain-containing protein, partial [Bacillota bacterium]|nr:DUF1697 domain-containing protein [Bacillota bacterium]
MTIYIALLRGINVGGKNIIKMADLKKLFESLNLTNVKTYIQSGNVLFKSDEPAKALQEKIESEIREVFGFPVSVILRTSEEFDYMIRNSPYESNSLADGESLSIALLGDVPDSERVDYVMGFSGEVDECQIVDKTVYLYFRQSIRDSKLAVQLSKL